MLRLVGIILTCGSLFFFFAANCRVEAVENIFYPPEKLNVSKTPPASNGRAGSLAYYAPWGDAVMFYGSFSPAPGLYDLGHAISGGEHRGNAWYYTH